MESGHFFGGATPFAEGTRLLDFGCRSLVPTYLKSVQIKVQANQQLNMSEPDLSGHSDGVEQKILSTTGFMRPPKG